MDRRGVCRQKGFGLGGVNTPHLPTVQQQIEVSASDQKTTERRLLIITALLAAISSQDLMPRYPGEDPVVVPPWGDKPAVSV